MVKTRSHPKTTATKSRPKAKRASEPEALFSKGAIVAIPGREAGNDFKLVKLLEDAYDQAEHIRVVYLKAYEHEPLRHIYYEDTIQGDIADSDIIIEADAEKFQGRLKSMGFRKSLYELKRHAFGKVKALAKNFQGIGKDEEESESEEEEEESSAEEEEEEEQKKTPARAIKKVAGKKGAAAKKKAEEEDMEEEQAAPRRSTRHSAKKTEEVTRSTKKQKVTGKKGKSTKEEELEEEEEEGDEEEVEEEEEVKTSAKGAPKAKAAAKGKKEKEKKPKKAHDPTKYTKGQFNPNIEVVEKSEMLESTDNHVIDYESTNANNKNIIRAVYTQNYKLLEECLQKKGFFSSLFQRWGVETDFNAIEIAFKNRDRKAIQMICKAVKDKALEFLPATSSGLSTFNTGSQSKYAYGAYTRRVQMGRGNKELNAALNKDDGSSGYPFDEITIERIVESDVEADLLDMLRVEVEGMESSLLNELPKAVQAGNQKVAAYIAQKLFKATGHGVNALHVEVLTKDDPKELSDFRKPSATAKTLMTNITPIHFACINPNPKILEALLSKVPEYGVPDFQMHRPIHYAAACSSPEPLKLLISKSIDFREGTRSKVTPLMIAAKYGRIENIKVLLGEGDLSIVPQKTRDGMSALHWAIERGHLDCVKALIEAGAGLDAPGRNKMTPLMAAAAHGHYDIVEFLLSSGAKILAKDKFKKTALIAAVTNGHIKIASYLLKHGADFNQADSSDNYPIHYAAAYGYVDCLDILKKAGADQNVYNALKVTPLTVALLKNNTGVMKKLLSYENTDVNCKDETGRTLIMCAIQSLSKANYEQIKYLIKEKNADTNIKDMEGATALHYACQIYPASLAQQSVNMIYFETQEKRQEEVEKMTKEYQQLQIDIVELLLANGADINKENEHGITPFFTAMQGHNFNICNILLKISSLNIAMINKKDEGIYHFLADIIDLKEGVELFYSIADLIGNKDGLVNHVDILGFTPILKFIKAFSDSTQSTLDLLYQKHTEEALNKKQKEWDEKHPKTEAKESAKLDSQNASLRGGARTKQTARRSTFGKAPRKMLASRPARQAFGGFGGFAGADDADERPVTLSVEEEEQVQEKAEQELSQVVDDFIRVLKRLIDLGANIGDSVHRLRPFRRMLRTKDLKEQDLKIKMIAEIIKKRRAEKTQQNMFGGGYNRYNRHMYNRPQSQGKDKKPLEFCPQGNQNALHLVQLYPHPNLVKFLLTFDSINVNQQDYMKRTPLYCFIKNQEEQLGYKTTSSHILELLLNHKADPNVGNINNELPAFMTVKLEKLYFLEVLAKHGVNLDVTNKSGETPLILSIKNKQFQYAEVLLKAGANPNIKGKRDRTALHYALNNSSAGADASFELESLLLKNGARINDVDVRGRTPLHYAFIKINDPFNVSRIDPVEIVTSYCGQKGVDVTIKDNWGSTPLHYAAQRGAQVCALTLLTLGADVNAKDNDGNTPLALAIKSGHPNVSIMLLQSQASVDDEVNIVKRNLQEEKKKEKERLSNEKAQAKTAMEVEKTTEDEEKTTAPETEKETLDEDALIELEELEQVQAEADDEQVEEEPEDEEEGVAQPYGYNPYGGGLFGHRHGHHGYQDHSGDLPEGKYSMFSAAIKKNYQGVAYLMLQSGYDLMSAIQDAMNEQKFNYVWTLLTKVEDQSVLHKTNLQGQNLFHTFAIKGRSAGTDLTDKIFNAFNNRGISFTIADVEGRTPLHYAAQYNFAQLFGYFMDNGADINVQDKKGFTPFTLQLVHGEYGIHVSNIQTYIKYHALFDLRFKVTIKGDDIEMGPLVYLVSKGNQNYEVFRQLINHKVSINESDEDGRTCLMYAIKQNSDKLVSFFLNYPELDRGQKDNDGRTPIHYVVSPLEYGSYENEKILELIAPYFNLNEADSQGKTPMYFAYLQDSGVMVQKLKELGAKDNKPPAHIKRAATSIVAGVDWPKEEIDYEEDAEKFLEEAAKLEKNMLHVEEKVKPDQSCENPEQHEVVYDDKLGPYDLYMTKVDINRGYYGGNVFYKMQLLHNKVRDFYRVLTRYGRIGEFGQHQNTPGSSKEEAIKEFSKIFRSKSGNDWTDKEHFQKVRGKYRLLEFTKRINHKEYLVPFDLKNPKVPKCDLDNEIKKIVNDITDVKMYQQMMTTFGLDTDIVPLASLNRSLLNEAQAILFEIKELINEIQELRYSDALDKNTKILELSEKIGEKSSRFYELLPDARYRNTPIPPIDNQHELGNKSKMIDNLLDFEISTRVMLGALNRTFELNPLDYCFQALNVKMVGLDKEHAEYQLVQQYLNASQHSADKEFIQNIFALERKGEAERTSQWSHLKNKMLLWHGSKIANFMGILGQGLRIAPPEAFTTGDMFGKGVYFADCFTKSYNYTQDWNVRKGYRLLLLCEVALGDMLELREAQNITELQAPYKSVKGLGRTGPKPDHKIVMPNGCVAPIGDVVDLYQGETDYQRLPRLSHNEYIVYDVSQVRVRYLVQVKDN